MSNLEAELEALKRQCKKVLVEVLSLAALDRHSAENQSEIEKQARYAAAVFSARRYRGEDAWEIQIVSRIRYGKTHIEKMLGRLDRLGSSEEDISEFVSNIDLGEPQSDISATLTANYGAIKLTVQEAYLIAQSIEPESKEE